ncbi:hypothetical protein [uncultured Bradyrhizobium sp.]|jgi:hypothetical protein|uniref:hypothetical protein n=1 Tax=uncultured Bradyrhizobium sp. TaxID=199684 RepID=UPI002601CECC|nr:hypothetical protein [uncultured Bradyrhizobium sp.]
MTQMSIQARSSHPVLAGILLVALLSPAYASDRSTSLDALHGLQGRAAEQLASVELTSHRPWLAPVGHHQPRRDDAPHSGTLSALEREQQQRDQILDRKLIICRGC